MATDDAIDPRYQLFARLRDTGYGMLAWCMAMAGLQTLPDDEYADLTAEVERIAALTNTPPPSADLMALVREIAATKELMLDTYTWGGKGCRFCGGPEVGSWPPGAQTFIAHEPDCLYVRSRAIVARLDAPPDSRLGEETP